MNNDFIIDNKNRNKVLNVFLDTLALKIVNNYLNLLEKNNNIPEPILNFLDQAIFLTRKKINIDKINVKIGYMPEEESINIQKILKENNKYKEIYERLNFLFYIIKEEEVKKYYLIFYIMIFLKYKKETEIKKQKSIDNIIKKLFINNNQKFDYYLIKKIT